MQSELLSTNELADTLKLSPGTIRGWVTAGKIPAVRTGKNLKFELDAVRAALEKQDGSNDR